MIAVAEGLRATLQALEAGKINYMAVGSIAAAVYGEPRLTRDLDLVLQVRRETAAEFIGLFSEGEFYVPAPDIVAQEFAHKGQFYLLHHGSGLKIDVVVQKANAHAIAEFDRRRPVELLPGLMTWLAAPEDIIIAKLRYFREGESDKHLRDIRGILAHATCDLAYLEAWITRLGLSEQWRLTFGSHVP
ncbi:MAG: hypothetical protein NTZ90_06075 [Proteobacteria bacterium]|nr:hypothetical protein [Pseudomonadota bacterium]